MAYFCGEARIQEKDEDPLVKFNRKMMWLVVLAALVAQAGAQILTSEQVKKLGEFLTRITLLARVRL